MTKIHLKQAIRDLQHTEEGKNAGSLIRTLDAVLPQLNLDNKIKNKNSEFSSIRAFDSNNSFICPIQPTCAGLVDIAFSCANGIENDINVTEVEACSKPYSIALFSNTFKAVEVPTNGIFADMSGSYASQQKECVQITPKHKYTYFDIDDRITCMSGAVCGTLIDNLVANQAKAQILGFRASILTEVGALATTVTSTGTDLLYKLQDTYEKLSMTSTNQNKKIVCYVNDVVIQRLLRLRDSNGRPLFDLLDKCPVTGCREVCFAGMILKSVEAEFAPITGTTTKVTDALFVVVDNVFGVKSATSFEEAKWNDMLINTNNKIASFQYNAVKVPTIFATSTAAKITLAL